METMTQTSGPMGVDAFRRARRTVTTVAVLAAMVLLGPSAAAHPVQGNRKAAPAEEGADSGAVLFRAGETKGAMELWTAALESGEGSNAERARLAYNLGVAAQASEDPLAAASWYESALRLQPRMTQAHHNRELARADAGLGPAHGDGMTAAGASFASRFTRAEVEWLAVGGALLFALACLLEALRGRTFRKAIWMSLILQPFFFGPLVWHLANGAESMHMVIEPGTTALYPMPDFGGGKVGTLDPGDKVAVIDELPGWSKVDVDGEGRWVQSEKLKRLDW